MSRRLTKLEEEDRIIGIDVQCCKEREGGGGKGHSLHSNQGSHVTAKFNNRFISSNGHLAL